MISFPLLKSNLRGALVLFLICAAIMAMYFSIIASMYDPNSLEAMDALLAALPPELVSALSFSIIDPSLTGFLAGYFYGFLILLFPLVFTVIVANRAVVRYVDSGSMAFLLSTPNSRAKIALTQALFVFGSVKLLIISIMLVGILVSAALFPGALDVWRFVLLNIGAILLYFVLSGIGFFASCLFNETRYSLALGAGLPALFFLMKMISGASPDLAPIGRASLTALFDPSAILALDSSVLPAFLTLLAIGAALYAAGIAVFVKKDLPL